MEDMCLFHTAWIWIWMTKRQWFHVLKDKWKYKHKREKKNQQVVLEIIPFIHLDKYLDRARIFFRIHARVKSAILAFFHESADWLDWPCPVSAAHNNCSLKIFFSFIFYFFFNMKPLLEVMPRLLVIQIQIQAVWFEFPHERKPERI